MLQLIFLEGLRRGEKWDPASQGTWAVVTYRKLTARFSTQESSQTEGGPQNLAFLEWTPFLFGFVNFHSKPVTLCVMCITLVLKVMVCPCCILKFCVFLSPCLELCFNFANRVSGDLQEATVSQGKSP